MLDWIDGLLDLIFGKDLNSGMALLKWIFSWIIKLELVAICFYGIFYGLKKLMINLFHKHKVNHQAPPPTVESYIPVTLKNHSAKCHVCGAAVPIMINGAMVTSCPFCSNPLEESKQILQRAQEAKNNAEYHAIRMQEFQQKEREQELERQLIISEQEANKTIRFQRTILPALGIIAFIALIIALLLRH